MSKQITVNYDGKSYHLAYNRRSVVKMEEQGFNAAEAQKTPISSTMKLFAGAFLANHPGLSEKTIEEIYKNMTGKEELNKVLSQLYADAVSSLFAEPEKSEKNAVWTAE